MRRLRARSCANRHLQDGMHIAGQPISNKVGENDRLRCICPAGRWKRRELARSLVPSLRMLLFSNSLYIYYSALLPKIVK